MIAQPAPSILIVDDTPENLQLLFLMLKESGYKARPVSSGNLALDAARKSPPDLILLDINMPGMDGYEVCAEFKKDPALKEIPVIFISALNDSLDKVQAFGVGGIDYITKPFQTQEVEARVKTHVTLYRQKQRERELLENTLNGSVKLLTEILYTTDPQSFDRTRKIRDQMAIFVENLEPEEKWEFELSSMLAAIGYVTIPQAIIIRAQQGFELSAAESDLIESVPRLGSSLLSHIPRLEPVAMNVLYQKKNFDGSGFPEDEICGEAIPKGGRVLRILDDYVKMLERNIPTESIFASMFRMNDLYDPKLVEQIAACFGVLTLTKEYQLTKQTLHVPISEMQEGDFLREDIVTENGVLFTCAGTVLTPMLLMKLKNFATLMNVTAPFEIRRIE